MDDPYSGILTDEQHIEIAAAKTIMELEELNKNHCQQHIDNHIKIAELLIENKRLKEGLSKLQRSTTIEEGYFDGPDNEGEM